MNKKLLAVAVLAIAVIGPPAAMPAFAVEASTAYERLALTPAELAIAPAVDVLELNVVAGGGKQDLLAVQSPPADPVRALVAIAGTRVVLRDREPVAYHLLL